MSLLPLLILFCAWRLLRPLWNRRPASRVPDFLLAIGLFLYCWPAAAWLFIATLEKQVPVAPFPPREADAIVALGGNFYPASGAHPQAEPGFATYLRSAHAAWLFHHWKRLPIVVSGGSAAAGAPSLAELMRRQLIGQGVPDSMIWVDDRSANTYANAVDTARILLPKGMRRIALVTEAFHMPRAELCFRKQGFSVMPAPSSCRTLELHSWMEFLVPRPWAIDVNQEAIHEWLGLAWYKIRGDI
jgi:uncharacterized SAM-binding protein YcdF (DUF218 family)